MNFYDLHLTDDYYFNPLRLNTELPKLLSTLSELTTYIDPIRMNKKTIINYILNGDFHKGIYGVERRITSGINLTTYTYLEDLKKIFEYIKYISKDIHLIYEPIISYYIDIIFLSKINFIRRYAENWVYKTDINRLITNTSYMSNKPIKNAYYKWIGNDRAEEEEYFIYNEAEEEELFEIENDLEEKRQNRDFEDMKEKEIIWKLEEVREKLENYNMSIYGGRKITDRIDGFLEPNKLTFMCSRCESKLFTWEGDDDYYRPPR